MVREVETPDDECSCWGYQLILDCFGCEEETCCNIDKGYDFLDKITSFLGMHKQTQPYVFKTCEVAFPGRPGYSGWVPIIESGIQVHTSANNRFISVDVYSCKPFDIQKVEEFTRAWFQPGRVELRLFHRGEDYRSKLMTASDLAVARPEQQEETSV